MPPAEARSIDRLTIRIISALGEADGITEAILDTAEDGIITPDENERLQQVIKALERIEVTAQEMKIWVRKNLKGGSKHG